MLDLEIVPIPILKDNYVWAVIAKSKKMSVIIDPGEAAPVINYLQKNQLTLDAIFITHHHWDHASGVGELVSQYPASIFGADQKKIPGITNQVTDNSIIHLSECLPAFHVISIPGHTLDHVAYYSDNILFSGDTLFSAGCGRNFEGTAEQLYLSLQKLAALKNTTQIYCGHEYTLKNLRFAEAVEPANEEIKRRIQQVMLLREQNKVTLPSLLADEKETNPFLRCNIQNVVASAERYAGKKLHHPVEVFTVLREWKNNY